MRKYTHLLSVLLLLPLLTFTTAHADEDESVGAVYTTSNAASGNQVLVFTRNSKGILSPAGSYDTGGLGTDSGLGNQGGLVLGKQGRLLFAINAGSNQISVFAVRHQGLELVQTVDSGGIRPISLTVDHGLLYVLNAGSDNITGFLVSRHGKLTPLPDSTRPLSGSGTGPAQIGFSPDGDVLVVTEKATNRILTYTVNDEGKAQGPFVHNSAGQTPFGFAFDRRGRLYVSEAAGGAPESSSVSSYEVKKNGGLEVISAAVPSTETAACWVAIPRNGRYAYTTNTGSGTLTGYRINKKTGNITLRDADGVTGVTGPGSAPIDLAFTRNSRFLYALNSGTDSIGAFRVGPHGALISIPGSSGLPLNANGLAAR